jgi:hypothetical protein
MVTLEPLEPLVEKEIDDLLGRRPAVHVIAEIDDDLALAARDGGVLANLFVDAPQKIGPAVDIPDGVDQRAVGDPRLG